MHEMTIAKNIIAEAEKQGKITGILLEIGELAHVPGKELVSCLKTLVKWKVNWTEKPAKVTCINCGFTGRPKVLERGHDSFYIACPRCGEDMPNLIDGKDIKIVSVEVQ